MPSLPTYYLHALTHLLSSTDLYPYPPPLHALTSKVGNPGYFVYTWEETKAVVALFAVSSSPLILGNDARAGRMQPRLLSLLLNKDMLAANSEYSATHAFAGGRLWSEPSGREVWAKPLKTAGAVAAVLFNRAGYVLGTPPPGSAPLPAFCADPGAPSYPCTGCFVDDDKPWRSMAKVAVLVAPWLATTGSTDCI